MLIVADGAGRVNQESAGWRRYSQHKPLAFGEGIADKILSGGEVVRVGSLMNLQRGIRAFCPQGLNQSYLECPK